MKTKKMIVVLLLLGIVPAGILCTDKSSFASKTEIIGNEKAKTITIDKKLTEVTHLLVGKKISKTSELYNFSSKWFYKNYRKRLLKNWNIFQRKNFIKMGKWWKKYKPEKQYDTIFYPFSGPDILNALTFFPASNKYILFGLEPVGEIPDPYKMSHRNIQFGLQKLQQSIHHIMRMNFFRTLSMKASLRTRSFYSITGILMYFLGLYDYEIISIKKFVVNNKSIIAKWKKSDDKTRWNRPSLQKRIPGLEIVFRKKEGKVQTLQYFSVNVNNKSLQSTASNFLPFLSKHGEMAAIMKAASYLLHHYSFTKIRTFILDSTSFIIQDSSGVPIKYFNKNIWDVSYHGYYYKPIPLFRNRHQPQLRINTRRFSTGKLPFSYGYLIRTSHLITAKKK